MTGLRSAVSAYFDNYAKFKGRSFRAQFWWVCLFNLVAIIALTVPVMIARAMSPSAQPGPLVIISALPLIVFIAATLIPWAAVYVRRLHDINLSGWILLALVIGMLIPIIGTFALIAYAVLACIPGTKYTNKYGDTPSPQYLHPRPNSA